ncbi:MAG: GTPase [Miltoncostaeaceae bacterium]
MSFTDRVQIHVQAGRGGHGCLSFRREAHTPRGGPDGGNGGRGGDVVLVADEQLTDLTPFRTRVHHKAPIGGAGEGRNRHGRNGEDLRVHVPPGTRVLRDGHEVAMLAEPGEAVTVARGGEGGVGNRAFRSSRHRAPRVTIPGEDGEEAWLSLEMRLPVAVAIIGLPNAGKTALLNALTGASATVAPYPHTTNEPALGPLRDDYGVIHLVADLPGVAADGSERRGAALGQLERASVVLHCLDSADPEDPAARLARVRDAVAAYMPDGARQVVVATKCDLAPAPPQADIATSAETGEGIAALRDELLGWLS